MVLNEKLNPSPLAPDLREDFYRDAANYLLNWYRCSRTSQLAIMEYITENIQHLIKQDLDKLLDYQIESSKILYSTVALLDKMIRISDEEKEVRLQENKK